MGIAAYRHWDVWIDGRPFISNYVPDEGSYEDAQLLLIGEAPGRIENDGYLLSNGSRLRAPFVGPAGQLLDRWMQEADVYRRNSLLTNVFPYQPPRNQYGLVAKDELRSVWWPRLREKIAKMPNLRIIVPIGAEALEALSLGVKTSITNWRGSIYGTEVNGRTIKTIPVLHPAGYFRNANIERECRIDWARIRREMEDSALNLPEEHFVIFPDKKQILAYCEYMEHEGEYMSVDIETPNRKISCVGFSIKPGEAMCIPVFDQEFWPDAQDRLWALGIVRRLMASKVPKVFQNGHFDNYHLAFAKCPVRAWLWDTLAEHHCLDPLAQHSLEYMASIDTRWPFWKKEAKDPDEARKYTKDMRRFHRYNCLDATAAGELHLKYKAQLEANGLMPIYISHYRAMFYPILSMMLRGMRTHDFQRRTLLAHLQLRMIEIQDQVERLAGEKLHAKKVFSVDKLRAYLYEKLGLPVFRVTKNKKNREAAEKPSTDIIAIRGLYLTLQDKIARGRDDIQDRLKTQRGRENRAKQVAEWERQSQILELVREFRQEYQRSTFLPTQRLDKDGRMRCTYKFTTKFGRLASQKSPLGTGSNLMNQPDYARQIFLPDPGCIFLEVDLSQAEWRVVCALTGEAELMRLARTRPWEFDIHRYVASLIFTRIMQRDVKPEEITKEQRDRGKRTAHAADYMEQGQTMSDQLLAKGYYLTPDECQAGIDAYLDAMYGIPQWQEAVGDYVRRFQIMETSWGRKIDFSALEFTPEVHRSAVAGQPQSEVADVLNQWGLIPMYARSKALRVLRKGKPSAGINTQTYDSMLISAPV